LPRRPERIEHAGPGSGAAAGTGASATSEAGSEAGRREGEAVMGGVSKTTRNVALVGPNGSGKTMLMESILFLTGAVGRKGRVADGNTVGDASAEARQRQMSTEVSCATTEHNGLTLTLVDCPGSIEFIHEAKCALLGVDAAVLVVEPVAERMITLAPLLHFLDAHTIPHLVFINKMDRSEARYRDLLDALRQVSGKPVIPHQYAIGRGESLVGYVDLVTEAAFRYQDGAPSDRIELPEEYREREQQARTEMLETLADFDDDLMEMLLEEQEPPAEEILRQLQKTLGADQVVPVFMGVAERDMGVRRLLEAIEKELPEPDVTALRRGVGGDGPPLVQVLKNHHLPHAGKLSLARVWRGQVKDGMTLGGMRIGGVYRLLGAQHQGIGEAGAGAIVGLGRMDEARTGQVLGEGAGLPVAETPKPMFAFAIVPTDRGDEVKLSGALAKLTDEDPSLIFQQDPEMGQSLLWGQGEMHLRVALDRLRNKYGIEVQLQPPQTPYRETIRKPASAHGRHKKQSGGHGQFGDVMIDIRPLGRGEGFQFENQIVGGAVPKQYIPAVEAGAREFMRRGALGFPVVDIAITLKDGKYHSVDSSELAFKMAAALALKEGLPQCNPVLLEPVLSVEVSAPSEYTSKVLQLVTTKRGQVLGYSAKEGWPGWDSVKANIPQAEMHDLIVSLRSLSQGVGFFEWAYDHLQEVPDRLAQQVVAQRQEGRAA
jgi:elongation factor G